MASAPELRFVSRDDYFHAGLTAVIWDQAIFTDIYFKKLHIWSQASTRVYAYFHINIGNSKEHKLVRVESFLTSLHLDPWNSKLA